MSYANGAIANVLIADPATIEKHLTCGKIGEKLPVEYYRSVTVGLKDC